jgi:hypothetical protein
LQIDKIYNSIFTNKGRQYKYPILQLGSKLPNNPFELRRYSKYTSDLPFSFPPEQRRERVMKGEILMRVQIPKQYKNTDT